MLDHLLYTLAFFPVFCIAAALCSLYQVLAQPWWTSMDASGLQLHYKEGSKYIEQVIKDCSTLQNGYNPPTLWGKNGHVQTALFGCIGRSSVPELPQQRYSIVAPDGSTLYYDVFEPDASTVGGVAGNEQPADEDSIPYTMFVCPGINNSSECSYIRGFAAYSLELGYRVVVFNHLGALKAEKLTGRRIFTYGGTGDISLVYEEVCQRYPRTTFVACGFSLGACILVRFLGEKKERRSRFLCMASLCQGYDPFLHVNYMYDWKKMRRLYAFHISKIHKKLISRHKHSLFPPPPTVEDPQTSSVDADSALSSAEQTLPEEYFNGFHTDITHAGHNSNGCSLEWRKCQPPDERALWNSTNMVEMDEAYARRVLGFASVEEMYRWVSCEELLNQIDDLPTLLVNSLDDPCIVVESHSIPKNFAEKHPKSLFVETQHGGHLGFYEGGVVPNRLSWLDRLLVEFSGACIQANQDPKLS